MRIEVLGSKAVAESVFGEGSGSILGKDGVRADCLRANLRLSVPEPPSKGFPKANLRVCQVARDILSDHNYRLSDSLDIW